MRKGRELFDVSVRHLTSYSMHALKAARLTSAELDWTAGDRNFRIVTASIAA